jgi:DNA-binding CsgD family transcriptional regulator
VAISTGLLGRRSECAALDELVASVRAGPSRVLVLRGAAGVGKSALLEYLVQHATGCGTARAAGVESEMELAFAGLHQLCAPYVDRLERLAGPQRDALGTAFGLQDGDAPDRFLVGLAVLSLLSELARRAGALSLLPVALNDRFSVELFAGRIAVAASLAAEADAVLEATGSRLTLHAAIALAGWRGREAEVVALTEARRQDALRRGEGLWLVADDWRSAVRYNALGRYEDALAAAERAAEDPHGLGTSTWLLADLIEAAVRSGRPERAAEALERLAEIADANGTLWNLGTYARGRALVSEGEGAERHYREAIERLGHSRIRVALARAHLLYGEWLRRENRRVDAREQLRVAHEMLADMGVEAFAERARRELLATGETVRKRTVETLDELTPQEGQIARLAADGNTNPEIGAQLFLSPRTVEWHLRKVFTKLGIGSRRQLHTALSDIGLTAAPV